MKSKMLSASCYGIVAVLLLFNISPCSSKVTGDSFADENKLLSPTKQDTLGRLTSEGLTSSDKKHAGNLIGKGFDDVKSGNTRKRSRTEKIPLLNNTRLEDKLSSLGKHDSKHLKLELKESRGIRSANKGPIADPMQQTTPLSTVHGDRLLNKSPPPFLHHNLVTPTVMLQIDPSVVFPRVREQETTESPAEQLDDALEDMMDMLRRHGSVLPENMSVYPDFGNYTEHDELEHEEVEGVEDDGVNEKEDEKEKGDEFEVDDDFLMTAIVNGTILGYHERETDKFEYDDDLIKPSGADTLPYIVHNLSSLVSDGYDPYFNYGHQYKPNRHEPGEIINHTQEPGEIINHTQEPGEIINPTPVLGRQTTATLSGKAAAITGGNATSGSPTKTVSVKEVTKKKTLAGSRGLSASAIFGIVVGTFIGFWLIMGPIVCFLKKVRDHHKEKEKRFTIGPRSGQDRPGNGIMEAMIMTELGMVPYRKKVLFKESKGSSERMSLTTDDMDTFHDACDVPEHLP